MLRSSARVLTVLVTAGLGPAQDPVSDAHLRANVRGTVVNKGGAPWADAAVTLFALGLGTIAGPGLVDVVKVSTDDKGRFTARLQRHRRYTTYAIDKLARTGEDNATQYRVSKFAEGVMSGGQVRLQEDRTVAGERSIQFMRLERLAGRGPFRAILVLAAENHHRIHLPMDAKRRVTLPPLPVGHHSIQVVDQAGRAMLSVATSAFRKPGTTKYTVRTRTRRIGVRDAKTGKGIAGAEILWPLAGELVPVGKTDEDGVVEFQVAAANSSAWRSYVATAKGYCTGSAHSRFRGLVVPGGRGKEKPLRKGFRPTATARLIKEVRYRGRVVFGGGRPAKGLTLVPTGVGWTPFTFTRASSFRRTLRTDPNGTYEIRGPDDDSGPFQFAPSQTGLAAVLTSADVSGLPKPWHRQVQRVTDELVVLADGVAGKTNRLPVIDLSRLVPVMFEVTDTRGLPAVGATLRLTSSSGFSYYYSWDTGVRFVTDRGGRVCVLMKSGVTRTLVASDGAAMATLHVATRSSPDDRSLVFARVKLPPTITISGRVKDAKGRPIAGLTLTVQPNWEGVVWGEEEETEALEFANPRGNAVALRRLEGHERTKVRVAFAGVPTTSNTNKSGKFSIEVDGHQKIVIHGRKSRLLFFSVALQEKVEVEGKSIEGLEFVAK